MLEVSIKGMLKNLYQSKEFTHPKTGVVTPPKWSGQFIEEIESEQGVQLVIHKINIPDSKVKEYKDKVGALVEMPVKVWVMNGKVGFTGV